MLDENDVYKKWLDAPEGERRDLEVKLAARVSRHAQAVAWKKLNEPQLDDLVQAIAIAVMSNLGRFQRKSKFSTWVHSIAENKVNGYLRTKMLERDRGEHIAVHSEDEDNDRPQKPIPSIPPKQERQVIIKEIFESLEEEDRVLVQHKQTGLTSREIAEAMGTTVEAVDSRWARLKPKLEKKFE